MSLREQQRAVATHRPSGDCPPIGDDPLSAQNAGELAHDHVLRIVAARTLVPIGRAAVNADNGEWWHPLSDGRSKEVRNPKLTRHARRRTATPVKPQTYWYDLPRWELWRHDDADPDAPMAGR